MKKSKILAFVLGVLVISGIGIWVVREMRVDSCLDRGGRWNAGNSACEGATE
ncbi:MAG: hypothetical protein ABWY27_19940 [Telluria sp.]